MLPVGLESSWSEQLQALSAPDKGTDEGEAHAPYAVLFPWFVQAIGILVFLLLTRTIHALPYTAIMFLVGTFMGVEADRTGSHDQLTESINLWIQINGEVVLLVFLPGLLFWDALDVNFYLFTASIWQLLTMAFPMVLAGTTLTALVGYYIFPYDWSFMLSMTFGSILAATDPVAVSALLNEVGAPPRLKMHVSGESLLNDGSAVVFYNIFSKMFLHDLNIGLGEEFSVGEGFKLFFRMSLGGACIGVCFGFGLLILLRLLSRRLEHEENVVQVIATITIAYLSFYTAEITCHTSGVIAVVLCGITTKAFGSSLVNDQHILRSFWVLVEHLLNTLLFTLGGVVWGEVISRSGDEDADFGAKDWGYLVLLYIFVQAIRFLLVFGCYPLISRIGLKSNWQEAVFVSFGGLRGAVGIALALSLDSEVFAHSDDKAQRTLTNKLFGMVGGIALLTLVINGTLAGPLLHKLGLAKSSSSRARIVAQCKKKIQEYILDRFVHLLSDERFYDVEFSFIRRHVPHLEHLTFEELNAAVQLNKESVAASSYKKPNLKKILPYLAGSDVDEAVQNISDISQGEEHSDSLATDEEVAEHNRPGSLRRESGFDFELVKELRLTFIELVRSAYNTMVEKGELTSKTSNGVVVYALEQSLDFAMDAVQKGEALGDWEASMLVSSSVTDDAKGCVSRLNFFKKNVGDGHAGSRFFIQLRFDVIRALAFISAHRTAQKEFARDFNECSNDFQAAAEIVKQESEVQVSEAEELLQSFDQNYVKAIVSNLFCVILLNKTARYIESLASTGLLTSREAHGLIEEVSESLVHLYKASPHEHPEETMAQSEDQYEQEHETPLLD